jgi:flagellar biosynthesis chaperone FliJ
VTVFKGYDDMDASHRVAYDMGRASAQARLREVEALLTACENRLREVEAERNAFDELYEREVKTRQKAEARVAELEAELLAREVMTRPEYQGGTTIDVEAAE